MKYKTKLKYFVKAPAYYQSIFKSLWIDYSLYFAINNEAIQETLAKVLKLINDGKYTESLKLIESISSKAIINLTNFEKSICSYYCSITLFMNAKLEEAVFKLEQAIESNEEVSYYYHNLAVLYFNLHDYTKVIPLLEKARKHCIPFYLSSAYLAIIYAFESDWYDSMICAQEAKQHKVEPKSLIELCLMTSSFKHSGKIISDLDFSSFYKSEIDLGYLFAKFPQVDFSNLSCVNESNNLTSVFFACDYKYFITYCIYAIFSINETREKTKVHVHLFNVNAEGDYFKRIFNIIQTLSYVDCSYSFEVVDYRSYYTDCPLYTSTMRFCRALQYIQLQKESVLILDCDSLFKVPLNTILRGIHSPIAILGDEYSPEWEKLAAGVVYLEVNKVAFNYIAHVSYFIMSNLLQGKGLWFLDQLALKFVYEVLLEDKNINYQRLGADIFCDLSCGDDSYLWMVTTQKEKSLAFNDFKKQLSSKYL